MVTRASEAVREAVITEAQRRLLAGQPTLREQLAAKFGVSARIVQDSIAVAKDRNQAAARDRDQDQRTAQSATASIGTSRDWRQFEAAVVQGAQKAPLHVLDDVLRRLASLRRSL